MSRFTVPAGYSSKLQSYETQAAIAMVKRLFQDKLGAALSLTRVSAPLFVDPESGLNDNLNGVERPVVFDIKDTGRNAEVVHSLAKWKRMALHRYDFHVGKGLYTDMNAIRRDEELDNLHSVYVDQWDWEKIITREQRNMDYLRGVVTQIVNCVCDTHEALQKAFPALDGAPLCRDIFFVTTQELEDMYPSLTPKEREHTCLRKYKTVFISQIGDLLRSGERHDGRAPDYDDWALNGDILFYDDVLDCALEISSMGIRVDAKSLDEQLTKAGCDDRRKCRFHKMLLNDELPLTIGGGIGQSRLCMLMLEKAHIGEVQASLWDDATLEAAAKCGIMIL